MKHRAGISAVLGLGILLLCGSAFGQAYEPATDCLNYTDYMHVTSSVPTEAKFLDRVGDLVYVSSHQVVDVSLPGDSQVVGSFTGQDGDVRGMTATATHLYMIYSAADGTGFNGLAVYDLADPLAPILKSKVAMPHFMTQLRVIGDRAYMRNDQGLLLIVDISDPNAALPAGSIGMGWLDSFDLDGNYLYAVDRLRNDVAVIDVTDMSSLQVDYRLPLNDVISITFDGGYGYFLDANNGTSVLEFTGPDMYTVTSDLPLLTRSLVARDGLAYSYGNPLEIYSLANPANPGLMVTVPFVVHSGLLEGDRALLGISNAFAEMDLSNPAELPGVVATQDVESTLTAMMRSGNDLVTLSRMGIETFDATNCLDPIAMGSLMWQDRVQGHALAGDYLYVLSAGSSFGQVTLKVFDLSDMSAPTEVAAKNMTGIFNGLTAVGDFLYTAEFNSLVLINVADPLNPAMHSRFDGVGFSPINAVDGPDMVVADGMMLRHFDVSMADNPVVTTSVDMGKEAAQIALGGGAAYVAHPGGVMIYATSNLGSKNLLGDLTVPGVVDGLLLDGNTLYVEGSGIYMFDVTDPGLTAFAGNLGYVADRVSHLTVMGQCLYFDQYTSGDRGRINIAHRHCTDDGGGETGVVIDIKPGSDENPINCRSDHGVIPVAILTTPDFDALSVDHNTVRFGPGEAMEAHSRGGRGNGRGHGHDDDEGELKRHESDVDGDGDIDLVFHFAREYANIGCDDTEAWLSGETFDGVAFTASDVVNAHRDCDDDDDDGDDGDDDGDDDDADKGLNGRPTLALSPNPFNPMTTIAFNLPASQRVRVEVYDLTGRRIAVVADDVFGAGENRLTWRGTDNSGRSMASGVYFVRVTGPGVELKQRAMLLK